MELIQTRIDGTRVALVKASFEHDVVLTSPELTKLELTSQFAERHGTRLAVNVNFFTWMDGSNIAGPLKALAWVFGRFGPIYSGQLRETISGTPVIPSGVIGTYYHAGECIIPHRTGMSINFTPGQPPVFSFQAPLHPYHVIEGTIPLILNGFPIKNEDQNLHPRTVIAASKTHYLFFVSHGRGNGGSPGITLSRIRDYLLEQGALFAAAVDGGESTSMIFDGKQLAFPCDKHVALAKLPNPMGLLALMKKVPAERPVGLNLGLR